MKESPKVLSKVCVRTLGTFRPPLSEPVLNGGRILMDSGELTQICNGVEVRFLSYVEFQTDFDVPRGNHYHGHRQESLYILNGSVRAVYEDIDTGERLTLELNTGDLVTVAARCAHVFFPLEYSQAIEFSPSVYDPADTIRYNIA